MSRWRAAGVHLALSVAVILLVLLVVLWLWYPPAWMAITGIHRLIALVGAVNIAVGPLLTLVVYRPGKPKLALDLVVIALLQAGFLFYGLSVLASNRPVFLVAAVDRYELVTAGQISPESLAAADAQYRQLSWYGPRVVGLQLPQGADPFRLVGAAFAGRDLPVQPAYYQPLANSAPVLIRRARSVEELANQLPASDADRLRQAAAAAGSLDRFVPITSERGGAGIVLIDDTARPVEALAIDPWGVPAEGATHHVTK